MKGPWKVTSQVIGDTKMYAVYRLIDTSETDHSGNREFAINYTRDKEAAEAVAKTLNYKTKDGYNTDIHIADDFHRT